MMKNDKIHLCILGSTGTIGESALDIVRRYPNHFDVVALGAGKNSSKLKAQIDEFNPKYAVLGSVDSVPEELKKVSCEVMVGENALNEIASLSEVDTVLAAIVGMQGLNSVNAAIKAGKKVCLANKESLVCAGELLIKLAKKHSASIVPVDSEHCSIFQCMQGVNREDISSIILTASGGPFLDKSIEDLWDVTPEQAAAHPRWKMGSKISIDSSTMVNKALEVIEAHFLFNALPVEVMIHPESIIHGIVRLVDGTEISHMSIPDMKAPIAFALTYPERARFKDVVSKMLLSERKTLTFRSLDNERFPAISLARNALECGGAMPAVFNGANEIAVGLFEQGKIRYPQILSVISRYLESFAGCAYSSVEELFSIRFEMENKLDSFTFR